MHPPNHHVPQQPTPHQPPLPSSTTAPPQPIKEMSTILNTDSESIFMTNNIQFQMEHQLRLLVKVHLFDPRIRDKSRNALRALAINTWCERVQKFQIEQQRPNPHSLRAILHRDPADVLRPDIASYANRLRRLLADKWDKRNGRIPLWIDADGNKITGEQRDENLRLSVSRNRDVLTEMSRLLKVWTEEWQVLCTEFWNQWSVDGQMAIFGVWVSWYGDHLGLVAHEQVDVQAVSTEAPFAAVPWEDLIRR